MGKRSSSQPVGQKRSAKEAATDPGPGDAGPLAVSVELTLASDSHFFAGLSGDLSDGGLFVSTYRKVNLGSPILLERALPNGTITTQGTVRWHRDACDWAPPGVGVTFDALSDDEAKAIRAFCAQRAPLYYELDLAGE